MSEDKNKNNVCAYCGTEYSEDDSTILLRSTVDPDLLICEHCISICSEAINLVGNINEIFGDVDFDEDFDEDFNNETAALSLEDIAKPSDLKNHFDNYIIKQDRAKKIISVAVYNHFKRAFYNNEHKNDDMKLKKSNVLMIGPSGCGKTLFVETLAKKLGVPYAIQDSTSLTASGYAII